MSDFKKVYTIEHLKNGLVAVDNRGNEYIEKLAAILKAAFPEGDFPSGIKNYYQISDSNKLNWTSKSSTSLPTQLVKDFVLPSKPICEPRIKGGSDDETDFIIGKWYVVDADNYTSEAKNDLLACWTGKPDENYGIDFLGEWSEKLTILKERNDARPATSAEVQTAMIAEAKKRGFYPMVDLLVNGSTIESDYYNEAKLCGYFRFDWQHGNLFSISIQSHDIFIRGKWATVIESKVPKAPDTLSLPKIEIIQKWMLVWDIDDQESKAKKAFVLLKLENAKIPYTIVPDQSIEKYFAGKEFVKIGIKYAKELPNHDGTEREIDGQTYLLTLKK